MTTLNYIPFDSHVHFRRGAMLRTVVPYTARQCWGAVVMPNTATPHILTPDDADAYRNEILFASHPVVGENFVPLVTGYLTPKTDPIDIAHGYKKGKWHGMKVYPPGATTHSNEGVAARDLLTHPALPVMADIGMPLLLHPEVNALHGDIVDPYDRERLFVDTLEELLYRYPTLRLSVEHVTDEATARFMMSYGKTGQVVCTITAQHLLFDRRDLHEDGWQPHLFCYPILKRKKSRDAVIALATGGFGFVSAGTDSAPHPTHAKERAAGCAGGVFSAHIMVELYAQAFANAGVP